jgi:hypothetical protein
VTSALDVARSLMTHRRTNGDEDDGKSNPHSSSYTPLHRHLDGGGRKWVLTRVGLYSTAVFGIEAVGQLEVEVLPGSVPMLHKGGTSMR